jgi:hypothetical protein
MAYKIRWKEKGTIYESSKTWKKKSTPLKKVKFIRQMDDDLRPRDRNKSLKTYRVVKVPSTKKIRK